MSGEVPMYYLSQGQYDQALMWVFSVYMPYGIFWALIGIVIFATVHEKSRSAAISGCILSAFFFIVNTIPDAVPYEVQPYFAVVCGVLLFAVFYKVIR